MLLSKLVPDKGVKMTSKEFKPWLIKAGAGTGKTKSLVDKVYSLFADEAFRAHKNHPPRLIVCTFTKKAAQELKDRLLNKAIIVFKQKEDKKEAHRKQKNQIPDKQDFLSPHYPLSFLNYVQSSALRISTIDGILSFFLKRYGRYGGLSPDFKISQTKSAEDLFDSLAKEFIFEKNLSLLKKLPYPYVKKLLLFYFENCLKHKSFSFYNLNDFTEFNKKRDLFLKEQDPYKKLTPDLILQNWFFSLKQVFLKKQTSTNSQEFFNEQIVFSQASDFTNIKNIFKEEKHFNQNLFLPLFKELDLAGKNLFPNFIKEKKKTAILDFNDLLLLSLSLLTEQPKIANNFNKEWDYWLIDEYQDTSWIQEQVIDKITNFKNVFCVGDRGQSIYNFRFADPELFKKRETALGDKTQTLDVNYRSQASLIYFYNDFFKNSKEDFITFKPPKNAQIDKNKPCAHFIVYKSLKKDNSKQQAFKALQTAIYKLKQQGVAFSDIAILSSRNEDLELTASYLRGQGIPVLLSSAKSFSKKQMILDSLFLLKFLINPFEDENLKALLRTPYFYLSDQKLVDSCLEYKDKQKQESDTKSFVEGFYPESYWQFIKQRFKDEKVILLLNSFLNLKHKKGLVKAFEEALSDCGLIDLSYLYDPTGAVESGLWKLLSLLNQGEFLALELFYSLTKKEKEGEDNQSTEPPSSGENQAVKLMTIHSSKGLEFSHVIVLDFSIAKSPPAGADQSREMIYDDFKQKVAFAIPEQGRDSKKIKSYGHLIVNKMRRKKILEEKHRLYYVALTRAKHTVTLFIPEDLPIKNSWLISQNFLYDFNFSGKVIAKKICNLKTGKLESIDFNFGFYKTNFYTVCVESAEQLINHKPEVKPKSLAKDLIKKEALLHKKDELKEEFLKNKGLDQSELLEDLEDLAQGEFFKETVDKKTIEKQLLELSSTDFINDCSKSLFKEQNLNSSKTPADSSKASVNSSQAPADSSQAPVDSSQASADISKTPVFNFYKAKNILLKKNLGTHLHLYLQKLSTQNLQSLLPLVKKAFLPPEKIKLLIEALNYINQLKQPDMSYFLKKGFSEWPFKIQHHHLLLQGSIDLWGWDKGAIYVFDYKSSLTYSEQTTKQLIFYSWVLNTIYKPQKIYFQALYPFQKTVSEVKLYNSSHQDLIDKWLKTKL